MLLFIHITIALFSLGFSIITAFAPSQQKINGNYLLILGVFVTGVVLTLDKPSHLPQTCLSGILYLSVVLFFLIFAKRKLATASASHNS